MSNRFRNKHSILFFWLACSLCFLPVYSSADTEVILPELIYDSSEHFTDIDSANLDALLQRIGDSRVVLLGEASHGTAEFYDMRARITRELIENKGFTIVAIEGDWPDAEIIDDYVRSIERSTDRGSGHKSTTKQPFTGYPSWMWANHSVLDFTRWLKDYNRSTVSTKDKVGFYGLDLYNLFGSIDAVLEYLQDVDTKGSKCRKLALRLPASMVT